MNVGCDDTRICSNYKMGEPWGGPLCGNYVPKPTPAPDVVAELMADLETRAGHYIADGGEWCRGVGGGIRRAADLVAPVLAAKDAEISQWRSEHAAERGGKAYWKELCKASQAQLAEAQGKLALSLHYMKPDPTPPGWIAAAAVRELLYVQNAKGCELHYYDVTWGPLIDRIKVLVAAAGDPVCAGITRTTLAGMPVIIDPSLPDGAFRIIGREGTYEFIAGPVPCPNAPCVSVAVLGWILGVALNSARFNANYGLSRIPEYIQAALRKEAADDCPDCKGYGTDSAESDYGCTTCKGTGNQPQEAADGQ